jgi:RND family efflux transporter MFP subunit
MAKLWAREATNGSPLLSRPKRLICAAYALTACAVFLPACGRSEASAEQGPAIPRVSVQVAAARAMTFHRAVQVQGNVSAKSFALVSPRLGGVVDEIFVDEGDEVFAGETKLFKTDSIKLLEAVAARRDDIAVAEANVREKQASLTEEKAEQVRTLFDWEQQLDLQRRDASSARELKLADAERQKSAAKVQHAEALVALAEAQLQQAQSYLVMAEKDLADSLVTAPITGRISGRYKEPGEMGNPGEPLLRIDDPRVIEISTFLPAEVFGEVTVRETIANVSVNGVELGQLAVCYKSPTIDPLTRTFEIRCDLRDPPASVAPGAMAQVEVVLEERQGLGVPTEAVQRRGAGAALFIVEAETARLRPVETGLEWAGLTQIIAGEVEAGVGVITVGGYFLDDGDAVTIAEETD